MFPTSFVWFDLALVMSGLSVWDRATIEPTLYQMFNEDSCEKKLAKLTSRGMDRATALKTLNRGCLTDKLHAQTEEFEYRRCTCQFHNPYVSYMVQCAHHMKNGILPFSGGYLEQPAILMEGIIMVQNFMHDEEERMRKREEAKAKSRTR